MRRYLLAALLALPVAGAAQEAEEDRGFLTDFLERNLSGAGREVRVTGFEGALSSQATMEELTIADGAGVWLTIREASISWKRSALLRGRVEIAELAAREIEVARRPQPSADPGLPDPEARPFQLPELPVSVDIGSIVIESVSLGESVLGEAVTLALDGALRLSDGEGAAMLAVERSDGTAGSLRLDAAFVNETEALSLDLSLSEPEGGIAATLLNLPGRPAMALSVTGQGPLSDFTAQIALSSDGEERLAGEVVLATAPVAAEGPPARTFALDIAGDLAPLFLPEYRAFFGPDTRLAARGSRLPDGRTEIEEFRAEAAALNLEGRLALAADGLPEAFDVSGRLAAADGAPVRLPMGGPVAEVAKARLRLEFDAARGDAWSGSLSVEGFERGSDRLGEAALIASGEIGRVPGGLDGRRVTAQLALSALDVRLADPALAEAVGTRLDASGALEWQAGAPLRLSGVQAQTDTARVVGAGTVGALEEGLPLTMQASANVSDLSAFSGLAGRALGGRIVLALNGTTTLLDGRFDLRAGGVGRDLAAGIEPLDRVIAGESRVGFDARRDETGITLRRFDITTPEARVAASGLVRSGETDLRAEARVDEAGRVFPGISGPAALRAAVRETAPGVYDLSASGEWPGEAVMGFEGRLSESAAGALTTEGRLTARVARLEAYSGVAGRQLRGSLDLAVAGEAALSEEVFDVTLDLTGEGLALGQPTIDRLLRGSATLSAAARHDGAETTIRRLSLSTPELSADVSGTIGRVEGRIEGEARLRDVGLFAPDFAGPASVTGALGRLTDGSWQADFQGRGPGNTVATISGSLAPTAETVDLALVGEAPLGLANAALAPQAVRGRAAFDLAMRGRPGLASLSGQVTTSGARLIAPGYGISVAGIGGGVTLSGSRANIDITGSVERGGRLGVSGTIGLAAPNEAALRIELARASFADPDLFETEVSGAVTISGPLRGGGLIGGALDVDTTEIRLAATGLGTGNELTGVRHLNEPGAVRLTRTRAGFVERAAAEGAGARPFALDLLVRAPNRIFIRGRGLDAELGGAVRLGGTTSDVVPRGQFELIRGRLDILGRRLALDEGFARLEGSFDPYVRLVATTEADEISVRIVVEGLASEPAIRFESSPELPEDEILARLLFGRGLSELSPLQAARLASAVAQLTGQGGAGIVDRLRQNFGLDDLDITTDQGGGTAVRAGRYLSENLYTEVTVGSEGQADVSINLDLSRALTVKGRVSSEGETGIGIFFERDY